MASEIIAAIKQICNEKNIPYESVIETIEAALAVAYRKDFGNKNQNIKVEFDAETGQSKVFDEKTVVEYVPEPEVPEAETAVASRESDSVDAVEKTAKSPEGSAPASQEGAQTPEGIAPISTEEEEKKFNPKTDLTREEAQKLDAKAQIGDVIRTELPVPSEYGRMAAQTAKQVIIQKLREAERENLFNEYKDKMGNIVSGIVQRVEGRVVLIDLGHAIAVMPPSEQMSNEHYAPGQKVKVFVVAVEKTNKGPEILVSRTHPEMVKTLFAIEVPEINSGAIEIKCLAREAGSRTKIAVRSMQENIDPIGSCVGQRGTRVQTVIGEIGGEKIDIIEWSDDPVRFIINALSPAKILSVKLDEKNKVAIAEVKEDQLSLAIGKAGQNVRLSSKLTGWRIDIVKESVDQKPVPKPETAKDTKFESTGVDAEKVEPKPESETETKTASASTPESAAESDSAAETAPEESKE